MGVSVFWNAEYNTSKDLTPSPPRRPAGLEDVLKGKEQAHHSLKKGKRQESTQQYLSSLDKLYPG